MFNRKQLTLAIIKSLSRGAIALLLSTGVVVFSSQQIVRISNSVQQNRTSSFILEKRSDTMAALRESFKKAGDGDQRIKAALTPMDDILNFVAALESLAASTSLEQAVKFGNPAPVFTEGNIAISSVDYTINLNGNVQTLMNYLKGFENLPYFSAINSINISGKTENGWEGDSTVVIQARLYVR